MAATLDTAYDNNSFNSETNSEINAISDESKMNNGLIHMRGGDTLQTQMSVDGAKTITALSPRITVTYHNVTKVISVPAKMIDPSSKERFIQRT
ncbi:unnamed protein product, partial [Adineta steineri]